MNDYLPRIVLKIGYRSVQDFLKDFKACQTEYSLSLIHILGVSSVDTMYRQVVYQVQNENMSLEEALSLGTRNVAKALEVYPCLLYTS